MEFTNRRHSYWLEKRRLLLPRVKELYESGESMTAISEKLGVGQEMIKNCIVDLRLPPITMVTCQTIKSRKLKATNKEKRKPFHDKVKKLYDEGRSTMYIATQIGRDRNFVKSCQQDIGLKIRSGSEANKLRMAKATIQERRKMTEKAHIAKRRLIRSPESARKYALAKQRSPINVGMFELDFIKELNSSGFDCIHQKAWKSYNFDIGIGDNFAVEIHTAACRPHNTSGDFIKIMDALSSGISLIYVWMRPTRKITDVAINEIISFHELTSSNPSTLGQYRVVRSNGEIDTVSNTYLDHIANIAATYHSLNTKIEN